MVKIDRIFGASGTGFLVRLSNLIIVQSLFVFAALALLLFYKPTTDHVAIDVSRQERAVRLAGGKLVACWKAGELVCGSASRPDTKDQGELTTAIESLQAAELLTLDQNNNLVSAPCNALFGDSMPGIISGEIVTAVDTALARTLLTQRPGFLLSSMHTQGTTLYYFRPSEPADPPVLLAALVRHDLFVSPRSELEYALMLLFLVSVLLALLTVHLIWKRFHQPLTRLLRGLSRTASGEVFYTMEEMKDQDTELVQLSESMNRMSHNLWSSRQQLKEYNERLRRINLSLLEAQRFMAALIDSSPVGIVVTSLSGEVIIFNREASTAFGLDSADVLGRSIENLFSQASSQGETIRQKTGGGEAFEAIGVHSEGKLFPVYIVVRPVRDEDGNVVGHIYMIRDISESKSFQDMMIRLDRYYTRGEMAGDIAHEINNYLAVLSGNLELLPIILRKGDEEKIQKKLELMRGTVDRIARFADGLMDTNPEEMHSEPVDMNQVIENVLAFLKPQNRLDLITLRTELAGDLSVVDLDASKMQQLLVNLIYNAADAIKGVDGEKIITVRSHRSSIEGEAAVTIEVCDNGPGVPEDRVDKLFKNRFTTKRKGHGIGLITCQRIIEAHGGHISYRFEGGALFSFTIPCHREVVAPAATEESPSTAPVTA